MSTTTDDNSTYASEAQATPQVDHPLDPLSPSELARAVEIVTRDQSLTASDLFVFVKLEEPSKSDLINWDGIGNLGRQARVATWSGVTRSLHEGIISLDQDAVLRWDHLKDAQSPVLATEVQRALQIAREDPQFVEALRKRGVSPDSELHIEAWAFGGLLPNRFEGRRVIYTPVWERKKPDGNPYAHPVHGLYAVIDLDTLELLEIEEHDPIPIPQNPGDYRASSTQPTRQVAPLEITQPEGAGFRVVGHHVSWQNWDMRIGFCPREGLVIHEVKYRDGDRTRRVAHRLSIAELVIPYGDPSPGSYRKNAFDVGEYLMGNFTNSLELGCDCLGEIRYLDAALVDNGGAVRTIRNAICLHEEDTGILWKHTDTDGHVEVRRSRRFVASSIVTVDNYEYAYYWYFGQDGSIEFEAKLTGIVLTRSGEPGAESAYGTEVSPGVVAPNHQHVFCARLDLDIDGTANSVVEVDAFAPPTGPQNPYGNAFIANETVLTRESMGRRNANPASARYWKVINSSVRNTTGGPVGYKLLPRNIVHPMASPDSSIGKRAQFMYSDLWVTAYDDDERYPAGDYPFQHPGGAGLPEWVAADRKTDNTDIVLWHVFGTTHLPRLEDWPIMPVDRAGFSLTPVGFFDGNPTLDVPPSAPKCTSHSCESPRN